MKTKERSKSKVEQKYDVQHDVAQTSKVSFKVIIVLIALVGVWGFTCLVNALIKYGMAGVVRSLMTAITGN
jgi:hypothetical protein